MNELAKTAGAPAVRTMDDLARVSEMFARSGFFKDSKDAAQCGIRILAGLELGFGVFQSINGVHIIQGRPSYSANLIAATVKRSGRYTYRVKEHTEQRCELTFLERDDGKWVEIGSSAFTLEDAKKANLLNNPTWRNYPRNMLFSRALTNGVRWHCPDVFGFAVYSPDELGAELDADGNVLEAEVVAEQPKQQEAAKVEKPKQQAKAPEPSGESVWKGWRSKDDPVLWAADQTDDHGSPLYGHHQHAQNSYDKAKREYMNSLEKEAQPGPDSSPEVKWAAFRALNEYFYQKVQAKKRGENYVLPAAGSQHLFEPIGEGEAIPAEAVGA